MPVPPPPGDLDEARRRALRRLAEEGVAVLFEDNHVLVVNKPAGLPSQGGRGIERHLVQLVDAYRQEAQKKPGRAFVGLVHRLDRNVSGVLVVAKTSKAARRLASAFRDRATELEKTYVAWVAGRPEADEGVLVHRLRRDGKVTHPASDDDPEGREARLTWRVEGRGPKAARLLVDLHTGLPHQIRAQLALAAHPILGDVKYGGPRAGRIALHALRLAFPHPVGGAVMAVHAAVPDDLVRLDRDLGILPPASGPRPPTGRPGVPSP